MLDLLDMATRCVRYQEHPHFDPEKIPHDDHETFALFARGDTFGIEMFSDLRIRSILRAEQPDDYASLMKVAALVGTEQDVWNRIPDTITAYRLMFIKAHYPRSFFAALLSHSYRDLHLFMRVLRDLENRKIVLLKPDINSSQYYFSVQPKGIQVGLMVVSGMTRQAYDIISHVRQSGEFSGAVDFCSRVLNTHAMHDSELNHVSQELIENLILGGVFDSCGYDRSQLLWMYNHYLEADTQKNLSESSTITGRFRLEAAYKEVEVPLSEPMSVSEKLAGERRVLGWNPGHKVFQKWTSVLQKTNCSGTSAVTARHVGDLLSVVGILCLDAVENHPLKCEGFEVYDCEGKAVLCLPSTVETLRVTVVPGEPVVMLGRVEHLKNELAFKAEYAMPLPLVQHLIDVPARMKIDASKLTPGEYWRLSKEFRGFAKGNCTLQIRNTIFTKPTWLFPKSVIVSPLLWYAWQKVLGTNCVLETDEPLPDELRIFNGIFQLKCQARQENIGL